VYFLPVPLLSATCAETAQTTSLKISHPTVRDTFLLKLHLRMLKARMPTLLQCLVHGSSTHSYTLDGFAPYASSAVLTAASHAQNGRVSAEQNSYAESGHNIQSRQLLDTGAVAISTRKIPARTHPAFALSHGHRCALPQSRQPTSPRRCESKLLPTAGGQHLGRRASAKGWLERRGGGDNGRGKERAREHGH
jgi:hypothetical protein